MMPTPADDEEKQAAEPPLVGDVAEPSGGPPPGPMHLTKVDPSGPFSVVHVPCCVPGPVHVACPEPEFVHMTPPDPGGPLGSGAAPEAVHVITGLPSVPVPLVHVGLPAPVPVHVCWPEAVFMQVTAPAPEPGGGGGAPGGVDAPGGGRQSPEDGTVLTCSMVPALAPCRVT
jgi:hypothetical protein